MNNLKNDIPQGFDTPTALPLNDEARHLWQETNRAWWESHPMRYDWNDGCRFPEFSREFYVEIDRRFFADAEEYLPKAKYPFDQLIPFEELSQMDVLEIGVGCGSHAGLLAPRARSYTGIDLTDYAVRCTTERLRHLGVKATILRMDAENMTFPDASFDYIWTWGVIHHSSDTAAILREMRRVLRPGGRALVMIYHRNFWNYYVFHGLFDGILRGMWWKSRSIHRIVQMRNDGGLARFYTSQEWKDLASRFMRVDSQRVVGSKAHLVPLPAGRFKRIVLCMLPNKFCRLLSNRLGLGTFLISSMRREYDL